jgi:protein-tyrosine phosphatase
MVYALFFLLVAAQFFVEAVLLGGYFWILAWPGVSFGLVGLAYLGLGPGVFGKRASGGLARWSTLLLFPYLLLTWLTWHLVRRMSREDCFNEVAPGIFVGRRPLPGELPREVTLLVDLTAEFPEHHQVRAGREYVAAPMLDAGIASEAAFHQLVQHIAHWPGGVYIHCAQGHGRTGTVAAAVLVAKGLHATPEAAIEAMQRVRPRLKLSRSQLKFVMDICARDERTA